MDLITELMHEKVYPHAVSAVELIETHLSWILLTGEFAYKVKKPIKLDFVDFSTLSRRKYFCEEEVRCNAKYSDGIYLGVVAIVRNKEGLLQISFDVEGDDNVEEWAVHMRQFDIRQQADALLGTAELTDAEVFRLGSSVGVRHIAQAPAAETEDIAIQIADNFHTIANLSCLHEEAEHLALIRSQTMRLVESNRAKLVRRKRNGYVRECHGDLHLANVVRLHGDLCAFDCLEFDRTLRNIDVWSDIAFMFMDLSFKGRTDLAYIFIDGYLDVTGDYDGGSLLGLFASYRAMIRAKINAIQCEQLLATSVVSSKQRLAALGYLNWAGLNAKKSAAYLIITHGFSGSGKSFWSKQLVSDLCCIRIRSDVLRKTTHGLGVLDSSHSDIATGLYSKEKNDQLYRAIAQQLHSLLASGENVLVDAACLHQWQQSIFCDVASDLDVQILCVDFTAPDQVLKKRVAARASQSGQVSEADGRVLDWQLGQQEPLLSGLSVIPFDTVEADYLALLQHIKDCLEIFD